MFRFATVWKWHNNSDGLKGIPRMEPWWEEIDDKGE
jgi:hypothetical protein